MCAVYLAEMIGRDMVGTADKDHRGMMNHVKKSIGNFGESFSKAIKGVAKQPHVQRKPSIGTAVDLGICCLLDSVKEQKILAWYMVIIKSNCWHFVQSG